MNKVTFGLSDKSFKILTSIFSNYPAISEVKIYCSRAKGTHSERSDLDLVIMNELDR